MIRTRGLTKEFELRRGRQTMKATAVDGIDLDVAEGEIVGFLGPNGAGKTTALRMLTTLLRPTAGEAIVAGYDVTAEPREVRRRIGYVAQNGATSGSARAGDEIVDHAMLYGVEAKTAATRGRDLLARLDLPDVWNRPTRTLSGGQRRRLDLTMGLVHAPQLLFLDEPTTGLDPQARANLWQHIADLRRTQGMTIFLTTHYLDEADALSDRIVVIDHGRIISADTPRALKAQLSGDLIELEVAEGFAVSEAAQRLAARTGGPVDVTGQRVAGRLPNAAREVPSLVRDLDQAGIELAAIEVRPPSLDDVFLTLTGRSLRDAG